jgi:hypothetical protein
VKKQNADLAGGSNTDLPEQKGAAVEPVITMFMCGPSKCEHDYSGGWVELEQGGSASCVKCGALAISEAYWSDF